MNVHFIQLGRGALVGLVLAIVVAAAGQPIENRYVPDAGGDWSVAENWSLGHVPLETERVVILAGSICDKVVIYNMGSPMTVDSLEIGGDGATTFLGRLEQQTPLHVLHDVLIGSGGAGEYVGNGADDLTVGGTLFVGYDSPGLFRSAPTASDAPFTIHSVSVSDHGRFVQSGGILTVLAGVTSSGEFVLEDCEFWLRGEFYGNGTVTLGNAFVALSWDNPGYSGILRARELRILQGFSPIFGRFAGERLTFDGPAFVYFLGGFLCSVIDMSARGTSLDECDHIETTSTLTDAPTTVRLTLRDGYEPVAGDILNLIRWEWSDPTHFSHFDLPALAAGLHWLVEETPVWLRLRVVSSEVCPGDVNGDWRIDVRDLAVLLSHFGMTEGAMFGDGDLSGDSAVDLADLSLLLNEFGKSCS